MTFTDYSERLYPTRCYLHDGTLYVPHYSHPGIYAAPGYSDGMRIQKGGVVEEATLKKVRAKEIIEMMWYRPWLHRAQREKEK